MSGGSDNVAFAFSDNKLNIYFTSPAAYTDPPDLAHVTDRPLIEVDSLSFSCIDEVCVFFQIPTLDSILGKNNVLAKPFKLVLR
jgi:hypothetical protein